MEYVVHYDVAALILSATLMIHYYLKDRIFTKTSGMFHLLMWVHLFGCIFDISTAVMFQHTGVLPNWAQYIFNGCYAVLVYGRAAVYLGYIVGVTKGVNARWNVWDYIKVIGLFAIEFVLVLITPFTKLVYYFNEDGTYQHGPLFDLLYAITIVYFVLAMLQGLIHRTSLKKMQMLTIEIYTLMNIIGIFIEMVSDRFLVAQFVASLAILLIYFSMENPEDYADRKLAVFNRDGLILRLSVLLDKKRKFRVLGIPVQGMKYLNDMIGVDNHVLLLKQVAEFFSHAGGVKNVFHVSNFGFAIIYKDDDSEEDCLVDTIRQRFEKPFYLNGLEVSLDASVATVHCPEDAETIDTLIDLLDYAMNEAAHEKEHVVLRADEKLLNRKRREGQILQHMRTALREHTFEVYYQPIFSVNKNQYTAAEALLRMPMTELGYIGPEEFIPLAEKHGMILEIGEMVFRMVCEFIMKERIWEKGIENIHVNLSVVQCMQERLAQNFLDIMQEYKLPCNRINLEVTETAAVVSSERLSMNMNRLVSSGVQFALDDYGTGFSNATSLIEYPYHTIKIDKGVVWAAMENENAMKVLSHSVAMIKSLKMNIVAEGVETKEQAKELTTMGCDYFQGYYYSKPISAAEFVALLNCN